ncbi:uncharacterized protein LOC126655983 [Mercurialis annua]|uniref:uncharacterized protein LOC126655983 n=1 Tax=Mercurialis annua TaxID=3986 RepID=UPI0024ADEE8A|nr:uncharacterized protein LOC126655983 [Mercurialis annua]XP_055959693.1 uncharacterized protein LOC126655983 [Mercurialis annua]XP_055959694.1 uncharacterized protein LOC126655983 [Mercurialis annua]
MEDSARSFDNLPSDWSGDPCLPAKNSWTGIKCSRDKLAKVITLDLTGIGMRISAFKHRQFKCNHASFAMREQTICSHSKLERDQRSINSGIWTKMNVKDQFLHH